MAFQKFAKPMRF